MSEIVMRQVDGIAVLDITKSFMQISRTSEERPKLHQLVTESLDSGRNKIVLNVSQVDHCSNTALGELIRVFKTIREARRSPEAFEPSSHPASRTRIDAHPQDL